MFWNIRFIIGIIIGIAAAVYNLPAGISLVRISKRLKEQTVTDNELIDKARRLMRKHRLKAAYRCNESELHDVSTLAKDAFIVGVGNIIVTVLIEIFVVYNIFVYFNS